MTAGLRSIQAEARRDRLISFQLFADWDQLIKGAEPDVLLIGTKNLQPRGPLWISLDMPGLGN